MLEIVNNFAFDKYPPTICNMISYVETSPAHVIILSVDTARDGAIS